MVPADPNPGSVYPGASAFTVRQVYTWKNLSRQHVVENDPGDGHDSVTAWFLPNGRVFVKTLQYPINRNLPEGVPERIQVQVSTRWAAYTIDGPDRLRARSDGGTEEVLPIEDGGRNVTWPSAHLTLTLQEWLTIELNRAAGGK